MKNGYKDRERYNNKYYLPYDLLGGTNQLDKLKVIFGN
jgi:hypothetical protein